PAGAQGQLDGVARVGATRRHQRVGDGADGGVGPADASGGRAVLRCRATVGRGPHRGGRERVTMTDDNDGPVRLLVLGAGGRGGHAYAGWCLDNPDAARVTGIAEPDAQRRAEIGDAHAVEPQYRFTDWQVALAPPGPWDAVIVATPDRTHVDPTARALELGYDVMLEKPMASTPAELDRLVAVAKDRPGAVTVSHVMRYAPFYRALHRLLGEGHIGELQGIQHLERIGYWH